MVMITVMRRSGQLVFVGFVAVSLTAALAGLAGQAERARAVPPPAKDVMGAAAATETAVLAGGCFWGVQGVFQHVTGVKNAVSGYAGGDKRTAQYERVGSGTTGHAEAVEITYDPRAISYGRLLQIFFSVAHDPTQLNRQGPDVGPQYRSAIFPTSGEQAELAKAYIEQLTQARVFPAAIVTKIEPAATFYAAEPYHQDFLTRHPDHPYIVINDLPKVEDLRRLYPDLFRRQPVLVGAR
jgi:peptide-methionine (S)-S-oxide reductase